MSNYRNADFTRGAIPLFADLPGDISRKIAGISILSIQKPMLIEAVARALADPTRLRLLRLLAHMELAVGELAQVLGQSQPRVSRHLGILCDCGLAERRREGSWTFLRQAVSASAGRGLHSAVAGGHLARPSLTQWCCTRCCTMLRNCAGIGGGSPRLPRWRGGLSPAVAVALPGKGLTTKIWLAERNASALNQGARG